MLRYVYTKELDVVSIGEYIMDVFALACQYDLKSMKHELEDIIAFNLTVENVVSILVMADGQRAVKVTTLSHLPQLCSCLPHKLSNSLRLSAASLY